MIVVANYGPLIALARIGHFWLLESLFGQLHIPPAVRNEVVVSGQGRPGTVAVDTEPWIGVEIIRDLTAVIQPVLNSDR